MKEFWISFLIGICFIYGSYMPFESPVGCVLKIALYTLGYWLIRYHGKNYLLWENKNE